MRNTLPLLSRPLGDGSSSNSGFTRSHNSSGQPAIPSIRLVTATPSATGLSSEASSSFNHNISASFEGSSWGSFPSSVLAPKQTEPTPKRRLVPKKSKLGLLNVVGGKDKENKRAAAMDGASNPSIGRGVEIYVDPTMDPDIGEILMVKKKKSRAALDGMRWAPLGEVTNVSAAAPSKNGDENKLKVKGEEKEKWWSIGRGRKDSKDKTKEGKENIVRGKSPEPRAVPLRSKTPEPLKLGTDSRARFNSLDSGILLNSPVNFGPSSVQICEPEITYSRAGTPTAGGLLAPPPNAHFASQGGNTQNQGSIAVRAMRSVRSLARIGSWAQLRKENGSYDEKEKDVKMKDTKKDAEGKKEKKAKKDKEKDDKKEKKSKKEKKEKKEKKDTLRVSTSSFEAGALSPAMPSSPLAPLRVKEGSQTLGKKASILGLGLPTSMRLPKLRSGSTASSIMAGQSNREMQHGPIVQNGRLSVESSDLLGRGRSSSVLSTGSSLRPVSTISSHSRISTNSGVSGSSQHSHSNGSGCSVKWDEAGLETVREVRKKEREEKAKEDGKKAKKEKKKKGVSEKGIESKRSAEGRKRVAITDIFPDIGSRRSSASTDAGSRRSSIGFQPQGPPLLMVEEATCDGHSGDFEEPLNGRKDIGTPSKRARPRPVSEQLLGRTRPQGMYQDDEGVISMLDAATNDLAQLIMTLNLEATPNTTPHTTPLRQTPNSVKGAIDDNFTEDLTGKIALMPESPLKTLRKSMDSISSLRPYAQSLRRTGSQLLLGSPKNTISKRPSKSHVGSPESLIGQQIAPWSKLVENLAPKKTPVSSPGEKGSKNKHLITPESISRPTSLRPSASPPSTFRKTHRRQVTPAPEPEPAPVFQPLRPAARPKSKGLNAATMNPSPTPRSVDESESSLEIGRGAIPTATVGTTIRGAPSSMTFGSPSPAPSMKKTSSSRERKVPIPPETRRILGMSGTLGTGSSDLPAIYAVPELDASDPDSDIPDELQFILATNRSDEASFRAAVAADDEDDTFSFPAPGAEDRNKKGSGPFGLPPTSPLPVPSPAKAEASPAMEHPPMFRARVVSGEDNHTGLQYLSEREVMSEEDTAKSFDFTGELKRLDESGGSDRKSFVEQLENAFKTPAKVELTFDLLGRRLSSVLANAPPIPNLPFAFPKEAEEKEVKKADQEASMPSQSSSGFNSQSEMFKVSRLVDEKEPTMATTTEASSRSRSVTDLCISESQILNMNEPTLLPGTDSLRSEDEEPSARLNVSISTTSSNRSNGELNTSFRFGGLPKLSPSPDSETTAEKLLTLSDIIPSLSHARSLAESSSAPEDEDSVLKSIYAKAKAGGAQPRARLVSNASSRRRSRRISGRSFYGHSRPGSVVSFTGLDSFEEIRRTFEFGGSRPIFYPPAANRRANHRQQDSVLSIASVSSYGRVVNPGSTDPFGFTLPSLQERPSSEDISSATFSFSVDDTFSFMHHRSRRIRVDSDASSFYFRPPLPNKSQTRGHHRQESSMSYMSTSGPPVSLYNRSFAAHRKTDSNTSASSIALSYAMHGASGGRAAWAKHRHDPSIDSIMSDISALKLGRPGLGDKMFDTTFDQYMPLPSISASPPEADRSSFLPPEYARSSYDSILDISEEPKSSGDSLFDKTGHQTSVMSDSVFGNDSRAGPGFQPRYRPLSVISLSGVHSPPKEDDTWISMIGGGHVRRNSVASVIQASPCARVEKQNKVHLQTMDRLKHELSPGEARIVEKPSIISTSSTKFGGERMIKATHGLLERQSLEDSCLVAEGEDASISFRAAPVFSRPLPAGRSRSSTCTSSSGGETPPLSSDGSSISGGSQSSIDLADLDSLLANATFPVSNPGLMRAHPRPRARGQGHRRRYSAARASRSSVYETIEEEAPNTNSPTHTVTSPKCAASPTTTVQPIVVVDSDTGSIDVTISDASFWGHERGIVALSKYYALRHEVEDTVTESKRQWVDTPFSIFAVQNFQPPRNPEGMKALLQHSVQNFGPLPSELRSRRRNRTHSRPSPYPLARVSRVFYPPELKDASTSLPASESVGNISPPQASAVLQEIPVNSNVPPSPAPSFKSKALSPEKDAAKRAFGHPPIRPRVASNARRAALGWTKRPVKSSNGDRGENKENKENVSYGSIKTPGDSLRLNRPRPRGRATPATQPRPIRV